jgi:cbb3-type cytochrome oxidase maturation protein
MNVFIFVTAVGSFVFFVFLCMLIWGIRSGQLEDLKMASQRAIWDDDKDD